MQSHFSIFVSAGCATGRQKPKDSRARRLRNTEQVDLAE
jgi:hypothetical protein